jgi:cell division protein FtsI/penicillin-binding protein 2
MFIGFATSEKVSEYRWMKTAKLFLRMGALFASLAIIWLFWDLQHQQNLAEEAARSQAIWQAGEPARRAERTRKAAQKAASDTATAKELARSDAIYAQAQKRQRNYERTHFGGYRCSDDCSGHRAGYEWALRNDIDDDRDCEGKSLSFIQGCFVFVTEIEEAEEEAEVDRIAQERREAEREAQNNCDPLDAATNDCSSPDDTLR